MIFNGNTVNISSLVSPIPLTHIPSEVYAPHAKTYFLFGVSPLTVTIDPGSYLTPIPGNSELLRETATPEPDSFPNKAILGNISIFFVICSWSEIR